MDFKRHFVDLPVALIREKRLRPADLRLYMQISLTPGCSISELSRLTGYGRGAVRSQCNRLSSCGWVVIVQEGMRKVVYPTMPHEIQNEVAEQYKETIRFASRVGQTHMYEWLKIMVDAYPIMVDVRPRFLQNPETNEYMEYDCFLPAPFNKAWEFHGHQHFGPTQMFPNKDALRKLQTRDHVKASLSQKYGIELVVVTAEDLSYEGMLAKTPADVPRKYVDPSDPYVLALESLCQEYAAGVRRMIARQERQVRNQQ
ncbi:MAG: MarR family transcriptional regulator [Bacillota bacterium]|nr:hypothetical protein [Candidatus Fermentithermobacillaceae bacterium]